MPKKFFDFALLGLWWLVLVIWQLSAPALAQAQPQSALDAKGTLSRGTEMTAATAVSDLTSKKVLILHSLTYAQPVYKIIDEALIESFVASGLEFNNLYFEFLDLARKPGQDYRDRLIDLFQNKYKGRKIDLVLTVHQEALSFLLKEGKNFYPEVPIISILGYPGIEYSDSKRPLVYLTTSIDVIPTAKQLLNLQPATKKLLVIAGSSAFDRRFESFVRLALGSWKSGLQVEYIDALSLDEILKKVANLPVKTAILYINVSADITGKSYVARDVGRMISQSANAPVFGLYDTLLGENGIVGGIMLSFRIEGERAVESAIEILRGNLPSKPLTILSAPLVPMFDWQQIKRWGLNESILPANTVFLNKPVSPWEMYKSYIIGGLAFIIAQAFLIAGLLIQKRRRTSAEELLARAEEKYRNIFESALEGIYETSPQGQFLTANRALARMLGYDSPEEVISSIRNTADQVWADPNGRADYVRLLDKQNVVRGFECQFFHKDGTKFWVSLNTRRVTGPDGQTLLYSGFLEDITGRKVAEQALEERWKFEMMLADLSGRFINVPTDRLDAVIEDAQRVVCEHLRIDVCTLWQVSPGQPGTLFLTHYHAPPDFPPLPKIMDARESVPWVLEQVLKGEDIIFSRLTDAPAEAARDLEVWRHYGIKSFLTFPLSAGGSVVFGALNFNVIRNERVWPPDLVQRLKLVGQVFANALLRRRTEESLRQKTEELDQFFNLSADLLRIGNTDGYSLRLNPAWERVLGYSHEELISKQFFDFVHPDDLERTRKAVSVLVSEQKLIHFENRYRCKDGTYRWLEWTSAPAGNLIYAAARDLTERMKAEAEGQQRREELAHVTRVAMMGEVTTSLAHEINQPLTAILSNAGAAQRFLSQATPDIGEVRQILDDIIRDDRRASEVVRRIRALVKKEKPRHEPLHLNEIIQQVVDLIRGDSLLQGLSIRTEFGPDLATIQGDGIQLQQVILNLILNGAAAMRHTPSGQRKIMVRTSMAAGRTVKAFVTDFGTGIDEHNIDRLFEPFYTTKPEGLGMGLSISQTIIKAHGGNMEASNNPEGGATFAFTLPINQGDPT